MKRQRLADRMSRLKLDKSTHSLSRVTSVSGCRNQRTGFSEPERWHSAVDHLVVAVAYEECLMPDANIASTPAHHHAPTLFVHAASGSDCQASAPDVSSLIILRGSSVAAQKQLNKHTFSQYLDQRQEIDRGR
jgi:hypothetical protein